MTKIISFYLLGGLNAYTYKDFPNTSVKSISTELNTVEEHGLEFLILSPKKETLDNLYNQWNKYNIKDKTSNISSLKPNYDSPLKMLSEKAFKPLKKINEDLTNASSISFLLNCPNKSILLLADSRAEIVVESLRNLGYSENHRLKCDYLKVSHHGSSNNTSAELLDLIDCENYIISTNGSSNHRHPSREVIGRIVHSPKRDLKKIRKIFLNYDLDSIKARIGDFVVNEDLKEANWEISNKNYF